MNRACASSMMASTLYKSAILLGALSMSISSCAGQNLPAERKGPYQIVPRQASFSNTTTPTPAATSCQVDCSVCAEAPSTFTWAQYSFTDTFVAATIVEVINTVDGTTKTSTKFNELPDGYKYPPTNSAGTQTTKITYTRAGQEVITEM